jgi:hypothetical protein
MGLDQQRGELLAPPRIAADREGAERVAVIALAPGDEMPPLRLALFDEILSRHLQRRLNGFRAAGDVIDMADSGRCAADQMVGQLLGRLGGEEAGMGISQLAGLFLHGAGYVRMAMAKAAHRRAAGGVDVTLAGGILDIDPLAADGDRIFVIDDAMQDAGAHEDILLRELLDAVQKVPKALS